MAVLKSLKVQNVKWILAVIASDSLVLLAFLYPSVLDEDIFSGRSVLKTVAAGVAPVIVLLLTSLLSSDVKAMLVFWRLRAVLPGHRAFSKYAVEDPRIDCDALQKSIGAFPTDPKQQNSLWYKLFKQADSNVIVGDAHRHYLLFRDLAALSLLLVLIAPFMLLAVGAEAAMLVAGLFLVQYVAAAIAARHNGARLVCNVLALHAAAEPAPTNKRRRPR